MTFPITMLSTIIWCGAPLLISWVSCRQSPAYHYPSDLEENLIYGPVIRMHTLQYETNDSTGVQTAVQENIELFNEHGSSPSDTVNYLKTGEHEINILYFHSNTAMREKQTFINGQLTAILRGTYLPSGQFIRIDFLNGNDSLLEYYLIDRVAENGVIIAARHFTPGGILLDSFSNVYNNFTRMHALTFDTTGNAIYQDSVEVNEQNWPVREINWIKSDGQIIRDTIIHQYDSLDQYGNWKIHTVKSMHQPAVRFVRTYTYKDEINKNVRSSTPAN